MVFPSSVGQQVVGRDSERAAILDFVASRTSSNNGGVMYIAGAPGTGKTLCVLNVLDTWCKNAGKEAGVCKYEYLNVIGLTEHRKVFTSIESAIKGKSFSSQIKKRGRSAPQDIGETFAQVSDCISSVVGVATSSCREPTTVIFVLDEIDYLCSSLSSSTRGGSSQSVLAAKKQVDLINGLFSLPSKLADTNCTLILIGIANSIDLSNRLMAMFASSRRSRSVKIDSTLLFRPYTANELSTIVNTVTENTLDAVSVGVCSQKVAAIHGDCRKVMDLCKQSMNCSRSELMQVMDSAFKSQADSFLTLKALPLQQLLVLVAACRFALSRPDRSEYDAGNLKSALLSLTKDLNVGASIVGHISTLHEHIVALSSCGLMTVKKNGKWSLNAPAEHLQETLRHTSALIKTALHD